MLERHPSILMRHSHGKAVQLADKTLNFQLSGQVNSYCCGERRFGRPLMALLAKKNLGPCRHALSQMVVAGTMYVQTPVQVKISSVEEEPQK